MERDRRSNCHSYARNWALRGLAVAGVVTLTWALGGQVVIYGLVNSANYFYTLDADFDQGTLFNVNHNAPNNNQLQLNQQLTTFPVMWIANAAEDTVSKIDTNLNAGAVPGCEVARYRTGFGPAGQPGFLSHPNNEYGGPAPSRTAVDSNGNVYVANRHFDGKRPETMKILASGFIDRNGNGVEDTSRDLNNDCMITGAEILPLGDTNGNGLVEQNEIQDERVAYIVPFGVANGLGRSLCIDVAGNLWGGQYNSNNYFKLNAADGSTILGPVATPGGTPYGCIVDANGELWGASLGSALTEINTNTNTLVAVRNHAAFGSDYGIAVGQDAGGNTRVYQATYSGNTYIEFNTATNAFSVPAAVKFSALGVAVDSAGNIIAGNFGGGQVAKFAPNGALIWNVAANAANGEIRGVVVDSNDDVWLIHRPTDRVSKHRGSDGAQLGTRTVGDGPYTYTDATGLQRFNTTQPTGNWTVVQDAGAGATWGTITWNTEAQGNVPTGASLVVEARASDNQGSLGSLPYVPVSNGTAFNMTGRYIEVRVTFTANSQGQSPVLSDIRIQAQAQAMACDIDGDSDVDKNDTTLIMAGRTPTAAPGDPRDANGDGKIDIVDARYCAARCTRPNCAP